MRRDLVLVSRCQKKLGPQRYLFHFKGFYLGKKIESIKIELMQESALTQYLDYILHLEFLEYHEDSKELLCRCLKVRPLE